MNIGLATDVGCVREINEDSIIGSALAPDAPNPFGLTAVLMVADGMGGHQAGEVASGLAADTVRRVFLAPAVLQGADDQRAQAALAECAIQAARRINQDIYAWGGQGLAHPGTTLTLCLCAGGQKTDEYTGDYTGEYTIVHVGDSRAYLRTRGGICQITQDDSWVGEAVRRGAMTLAEARDSPLRNQLTKCIGIAPDVQPSLYQGAWGAGDALILCSDGLSEYVTEGELRDAFGSGASLQGSCERLTALARERGGHDNISVVAACEGVPHTLTRKPPTWQGEAIAAQTESALPPVARVKDPNRFLRPVLLGLTGMGFVAMGMAAGRLRHSAAPADARKARLSASAPVSIPASPPASIAAPVPAPVKAGSGAGETGAKPQARHRRRKPATPPDDKSQEDKSQKAEAGDSNNDGNNDRNDRNNRE